MTKKEYIQDTAQKLMLKRLVDYRTDAEKLAAWAVKAATILADKVFYEPEPMTIDDSMFECEQEKIIDCIPNPFNCASVTIHSMRDVEKNAILAAMEEFNWHRRDAAAKLGLSERTLYRKLSEYGMTGVRTNRGKRRNRYITGK